MKYFYLLFVGVILAFSFVAYADTNGIWRNAEDIRAGVFSADEFFTGKYIFTSDLNVWGDLIVKEKVVVSGTDFLLNTLQINGNAQFSEALGVDSIRTYNSASFTFHPNVNFEKTISMNSLNTNQLRANKIYVNSTHFTVTLN